MLSIPYEIKIWSPKYVSELEEYDGETYRYKIKILQIDSVGEYKFYDLTKTLVLVLTIEIKYMRWLRR